MANAFLSNPRAIREEGNKIIDESVNFRNSADKIMEDVDYMVEHFYVSDGSRVLAEHIKSYKNDLYAMAKIMNEYGAFCVNFGSTVAINEQKMVDEYNVNKN